MTRACKTLHQIEFTAADGARKTIPAGRVVEPGLIPADELAALVALKAVRLFDFLDLDRDGRPGGSKRGRRRKAVEPTPAVEPEAAETVVEPTAAPDVEEALFD